MLRFYDKIDLVKPAYVDPSNKYRYYTYDQFWCIDIIKCCRGLDVPMEKISNILASKDNNKVLDLLLEQQKEALYLSRYYRQVAEDVEWYSKQHKQIRQSKGKSYVTIKHFPERMVLYGKNDDETRAYHLKLQELCRKALKCTTSIRRKYGFILDKTQIYENKFIKEGEYIQFDKAVQGDVDPAYLTVLPSGDYACCIVDVVNDKADFSTLLHWIKKENVSMDYVIADEIGLQLFEYLDHGYPCEVKVLLK